MATTIKGITTVQRGIEAAETGINVETFDVTYKPEFKDFLTDYTGHVAITAIADTMSTISVTGDWYTGNTGLVATAFATTIAFGNDIDGYGQTAGGTYADEVTIGQSRDGFRKFSATWTRHKNVT